MTEVYLLRHGEAAHNLTAAEQIGGRSSSSPLTRRGQKQALRAGRHLADITFSTFVSSTALRARQSMQEALAGMSLPQQPIELYEDLEEMTQGPADGKPRSAIYTPEVQALMDLKGLDFAIPGGETIREIGKQGLSRILMLADKEPGGTLLVATHGLRIRALIGEALSWDRERILKTETPNGSLTRLTIHEGSKIELHYIGKDIAGTRPPENEL